jgi:hypothetical protein
MGPIVSSPVEENKTGGRTAQLTSEAPPRPTGSRPAERRRARLTAPRALSDAEGPAPRALSNAEGPAPRALSNVERPAPRALSNVEGPAPRALSDAEGLVLLVLTHAEGLVPSPAEGSDAQVTFELSPQPACSRPAGPWRPAPQYCGGLGRPLSDGSLPRRSLAESVLRGNENKPLRAISNRNTNERRNAATLSTSTTFNFLIATKMHFSEEKAKRE